MVKVPGNVDPRRTCLLRTQSRHRLPPPRRQIHLHLDGLIDISHRNDEGWSTIEDGKIAIDKVGSHRHFPTVNPIVDSDFLEVLPLDHPSVLGGLLKTKRLTLCIFSMDLIDVSGILPNQVGPRCPGRHHQLAGIWPRRLAPELNVNEVFICVAESENVLRLSRRRRLLSEHWKCDHPPHQHPGQAHA